MIPIIKQIKKNISFQKILLLNVTYFNEKKYIITGINNISSSSVRHNLYFLFFCFFISIYIFLFSYAFSICLF